MSDPAETARRDAFENDVRTALFRPGGELHRRQFRVMAFAVGVALIALLATTWLVVQERDGHTDLHSGSSLAGLGLGAQASLGGVGVVMLLVYVILAVGLLVLATETTYALVAAIAGLIVTFIMVVNQPDDTPTMDVEWTGAPFVAMLLWLIAIILAAIARTTTRRS